MSRGIDLQQKPKQMDDAAGIFVAEAAGFAIGPARIEGKDRLEMRRAKLCRPELLGAEAGKADHAHISVAPGPRRHPFAQIVAVAGARAAPLPIAPSPRGFPPA